jgi:hypothetical protein
MIADLNTLKFDSSFFAKLICREVALDCLRDSVIYVLTDNIPEWNDAVLKVQQSVSQSRIKALWHLPFSIEALTDLSPLENDERLLEYMEDIQPGSNILMPLYTPDRAYKCYFVGRLDEPKHMEAAFGMLTVDAQKVFEECSYAAFASSIETDPKAARKLWQQLLDGNQSNLLPVGNHITFKGKYNKSASEYTFLGKGFEQTLDIPKMQYSDLLDSLSKFPDTVEAISKNTDNIRSSEQVEFVKICHSLSAIDKNELILELAKRIKDKKLLAEAIDAVINKARSSRLTIELVKKESSAKEDGRRKHGDWCTYLVDSNGKRQWLDFEPAAHVIYIMNLIHRVNNPDELSVVDVRSQKEAFISIYDSIYLGNGKEQYRRLSDHVEKKSGEGLERKRLKDCYKIIANCVNVNCSYFNENPSPYITTMDKPLTVSASNIKISEDFMKLEAIKQLFVKK